MNVGQLCFLLFPVLIEDEKQLLGSSGGKDWKETLSTAFDDFPDLLFEHLLSDGSVLVHSDPKCALNDKNVNVRLGNFRFHDVSVLFA